MMGLVSLAIGLGGMLLTSLMRPKQKDQVGPRLADVNVPSVSPGNPIPRLWGTMKLAGQIIWVSRLIETPHTESAQGGKGGGKGGGGKGGPKSTTYTYAVDAAIAVCRGPVYQVNRIWANQKLLWVNPKLKDQAEQDFLAAYQAEFLRLVEEEYMVDYDMAYASAFFFAFNNYRQDEYTYGTQADALAFIVAHPASSFDHSEYPAPNPGDVNSLLSLMLDGLGHDMQYASYKIRFDQMDLYLGDDTQTPNGKIESWIGVGNVPAFRGVCYFVLHNLQLEDFGDAVPTFNVEVQESAESDTTYLYQVLNDVCAEAGMDTSEYDSASYMDLSAKMDGFALTQPTTPRDAINQLQKVFPFDAAETNYKLVFSWINQRPTMLLRREDFGAHADSDQMPTSEELKRIHDLDLPKRVNLRFQERVRNFSPNMVFAQRMATTSQTIDDRDVTIALTRDDAKKWAEEQLALAFTARRSYKVYLPRKYVIIEPGDVVLAPDRDYADTRYGLRCVEANIGNNGVVEASFIDHFYHVDMTAATAGDSDAAYDKSPTILPLGSATVAYMLDCPLLTDTEADNVGFYTVLDGNTTGWIGGVLLVDMGQGEAAEAFGKTVTSEGSGSSWVTLAQSGDQSPHGYAMTSLDPSCKPLMWDRTSQLTVYMRNRAFLLASATETDLLTQPLNLAMVGDEIVQFANATDLGNGVWRLDTFLRGLRGTEGAIPTHMRGERFVRLRAASTKRIAHDQRYLGAPETYRAISFGDTSDSAASFRFANSGNSLRPRAPQFRRCYHKDDGDVILNWLPRARQNGNLTSGRPVALDQPDERYEIDVMAGAIVAKTYALSDVRTWTYTSAAQTADLGGTPSAITFRLYQIGQIIGRGYAAETTL